MKNILFLSKGDNAPSTRYRVFSYFEGLRQAGFNPTHQSTRGGLLKKLALLQQVQAADIVVINRRTFPSVFTFLLRKAAKVLIFDFDDAVFTSSKGEKDNRRRRFINMVANCDEVWAGNRYLAEVTKQHNSAVIEIPTAVNAERYQAAVVKEKEVIPTLVWIGSSSTKKYLDKVIPVLDSLATELTFQLKIIADFTVKTEHLKVIAVAWQAQTEIAELKLVISVLRRCLMMNGHGANARLRFYNILPQNCLVFPRLSEPMKLLLMTVGQGFLPTLLMNGKQRLKT